MITRELNKNFGIRISKEQAEAQFINRAKGMLDVWRRKIAPYEKYEPLFDYVCFHLGIHAKDKKFFNSIPHVYELVKDDGFMGMLGVLASVRKYYEKEPQLTGIIDESVGNYLDEMGEHRQVHYDKGMFYPAGEAVLDDVLMEGSLIRLEPYPNEYKDFKNALKALGDGNISGAVGGVYTCVEGLTRILLGNKKTLINNKLELLKKVDLGERWGAILNQFIEIGNEHSRHADAGRHDITEEEAFAFVYMGGTLINLIVKKLNTPAV